MTIIPEPIRPQYSDGQYLQLADFVDEQTYHRRAMERHEIGQHTWGLVTGFDLVETTDPSNASYVDVSVAPGLAVDGYGRQIVSFSHLVLDSALFASFTDISHHSVWLTYDEQSVTPSADGYADCSTSQNTRTLETFRLVVDPIVTTTDVIVEGLPADAPPAADATIPADRSVPYQEMPDEPPLGRWLLQLGSVLWNGSQSRFQPSGDRLSEGRVYAGAIASQVLTPAASLRLAPRTAFTDPDAADFAGVEGRLRVQGRINAEKELWMEGNPIRFTNTGGGEDNTPITLGRETDPAKKYRLRLRLGDVATDANKFVVGRTDTDAAANTLAEVISDGRVRVPNGPLDMGSTNRQEIDLNTADYGIGTQTNVLYARTPSMLAVYAGGVHDDTPLSPGAGGVRRLLLNDEGSLDFGKTTHQMLDLWSASDTSHNYGIGVQSCTLYFRTDYDVCWFKGGAHSDLRDNPGGGTLMMKLDDSSSLSVYGQAMVGGNLTVGAGGDAALISRHVKGKQSGADGFDHLYLNWGTGTNVVVGGGGTSSLLDVSGGLAVRGTGQSAVQSVIKVLTKSVQVTNNFSYPNSSPAGWSVSWSGELDEVYSVIAVVSGWSVVGGPFESSPGRTISVDVIPQTVWATVTSFDNYGASGQAYCAQSNESEDSNNTVGLTVVAFGRKLP